MTVDLMLIAPLCVAVLFLFVFVYMRESAISKKLKVYERTFDLINQNLHRLDKEIKLKSTTNSDEDTAQRQTSATTMEEFSEIGGLLMDKFQELQKDNLEFKRSLMEKYVDLENKLRPITSVSPGFTGVDESKIVTLFSNGLSIEEIAKQMRIGTGEVEFVLKMHR